MRLEQLSVRGQGGWRPGDEDEKGVIHPEEYGERSEEAGRKAHRRSAERWQRIRKWQKLTAQH